MPKIPIPSFRDPEYCSFLSIPEHTKLICNNFINDIPYLMKIIQKSRTGFEKKILDKHACYVDNIMSKWYYNKTTFNSIEKNFDPEILPGLTEKEFMQSLTLKENLKKHTEPSGWDDGVLVRYTYADQIELEKKKQDQYLLACKAHQKYTWKLLLCCCIDMYRKKNPDKHIAVNGLRYKLQKRIDPKMFSSGSQCAAAVYKNGVRRRCQLGGHQYYYKDKKTNSKVALCRMHTYRFEILRHTMKVFENPNDKKTRDKFIGLPIRYKNNKLHKSLNKNLAKFLRCWYNRFLFQPTDLLHARNYHN